jgi:UDP-N-acetylmuramoylalanine--D-glutamate ligase
MKIAIAGYGAEGESNYRYWNTPENQVVIIDERQPSRAVPVDASIIIGDDAFSKLEGYDVVVRTAGLAPRKIRTDGKIWSATNEFLSKCPAPIIGVTGSKGKGTTSSLIASVLRAAGKTVHLVGNIGIPALDVLADIQADDIVVYELSSFQLWDAEKSPHIAVVLMIEPDHLDVHTDLEEYIQAKANIVRHQYPTDVTVYNSENPHARTISELSRASKVGFQSVTSAHVADGNFWYGEQRLCTIDALKLPGVHNLDNACAAIDAVWPYTQDGNVIERGLAAFGGLSHRLKFVRELDGVKYYDDSIATTPGSAIAAMRAFEQPKILILGGSSKGADFSELANVASQSSVAVAILIGDEAIKIESALQRVGVRAVNLGTDTTMDQVVSIARQQASTGDVVILSPSCASFGMFKNYSDRGDQFIASVNALQ